MVKDLNVVIVGGGQLAKALKYFIYPKATILDYPTIDLSSESSVRAAFFKIPRMDVLINAAAWTDVNAAEIKSNKKRVYAVNASGVGYLADAANRFDATFVHISSDYVFDGKNHSHLETESINPLNEYGKSKAKGERLAKKAKKYYLIRTSWLIGDNVPSISSPNFVKTMFNLAVQGKSVKVVNDQFGRLTFTSELARAIKYLIDIKAPFGIYNVSNSGAVMAWSDIANKVFKTVKQHEIVDNVGDVTGVTAAQYEQEFPPAVPIKRPKYSDFNLEKLESTGFIPLDHEDLLYHYVVKLIEEYRVGELR